ncbi:lycopene beta-cyclase CrtY [Mangrovicella endophytica]|uniref:lycopene beta-cyclase CrtY n=1 Tax=Mangrovicella endophytica TaxID=2066697 RepID=UPI000C9E5B44|nr:lycopene beta-cyclase CrtY [Mangrovicella endophytica]
MPDRDCDIALVGGGLANGLIAWRLRQRRPELLVRIFEAGAIGGNHTWSFHAGDISAETAAWLEPFVCHRWSDYEVRFPARRRVIGTGYQSVTSERFRQVLSATLGDAIETGFAVEHLTANTVVLADGRTIRAACVIDGRGFTPTPHLQLGFQKFLGQEAELAAPHRLVRPIIMDATVPQRDGYRFVYVLPLSTTRLLVEDTYYADGPDLDPDRLRTSIDAYLASHGWQMKAVEREEHGVLPIALGGDIQAFWEEKQGQPSSGLAAALFHPTTGYSLPDAVRLADCIAALPDIASPSVFTTIRDHSIATWKERSYFRMLNKLLFLAGEPAERYRILEHFHRLPDGLIARFYAGRLRLSDKLRILSGKPPVPVGRAVRVLAGAGFFRRAVA